MQVASRLQVARHALRHAICTRCEQRPQGSESLPPTVARSCEGACTIFANLPELLFIAARTQAPTLDPYEHAIREDVCQHCTAVSDAGDYCSARATRQCPLSRHTGDVVAVLERLVRLRQAGLLHRLARQGQSGA